MGYESQKTLFITYRNGADGADGTSPKDFNLTASAYAIIKDKDGNIKENGLFVAIKGFDADGHEYIETAIKQGAVAVIVEEGITADMIKKIPANITVVVAKDTRYALAICSCNFYDNPSRKFKLI